MSFISDFISNAHIVVVVICFLIGLALIIKGGDMFVDSASWMATATGIPKLIVGATIVSLGTTLPELLVSIIASINGEFDMAAGNALGSITANTALIMSLALIFMPGSIKRKEFIPKTLLFFIPFVIMFAFSFKGNQNTSLPLIASIILLIIFIINIIDNVFGAKKHLKAERLNTNNSNEKPKVTQKEVVKNLTFFIIGAVFIFFGAQLLQTSATVIAEGLGMSKQMIALTIVAIGTSLPELVTTITAIAKKESSISVGNVIGANIINITLIMPLCGLISGGALPLSAQTIIIDVAVCVLVGLVALLPALITGKFSKWQGYLNICLYLAYVTLIVIGVDKIGVFIG